MIDDAPPEVSKADSGFFHTHLGDIVRDVEAARNESTLKPAGLALLKKSLVHLGRAVKRAVKIRDGSKAGASPAPVDLEEIHTQLGAVGLLLHDLRNYIVHPSEGSTLVRKALASCHRVHARIFELDPSIRMEH